MIAFSDLNHNQRKAVEWSGGPLLVLAGPGSGKTAVLTLRVARLLEYDPGTSVLALTFTNKAAAEMRERVERILGVRAERAQLRTFHSFASDVLSQHGSHLGIRPDFGLLNRDEDRIALLEEVTRHLPGGSDEIPEDPVRLIRVIDRLFAEGYAGQGESTSLTSTPLWLPLLFQRYCEALIQANRLDFGSLLHYAVRLLTEKPAVARVVRIGWTHVCVDEFQDTNQAQYRLLRCLAPARDHNLFVVADDDQIVYQWNGASPKRFRDLRRDYELETIPLPESYRCPPAIVSHANSLIEHNPDRLSAKRIIAVRDSGDQYQTDTVRYQVFPSPEAEAEFILRDIHERGVSPTDCAVIGRTRQLIRDAAESLSKAGLDAHVPQRKSEFDSPLLNVFVEVLRLANSRHDRVVLRRICRAWEGLTGVAVDPHAVEATCALVGGDFLRAWVDAANEKGVKKWRVVVQGIESRLVDRLMFPQVVDLFLDGEWQKWVGDNSTETTKEEIDTWRGLHGDIVAEHGNGLALNAYLQQLDSLSKSPAPGPNALRCMTVHGSKGLESEHVYLIGMAQEVFPTFHALQKGSRSKEMEEERRSCFVAITRARATLTLTRSRQYRDYPKRESQFLEEMEISGVER